MIKVPAMNISLQRRIGRLPKSPDYLSNVPPRIFENNHGGFIGRTPTPIYAGFFGHKAGHASNTMGDGKTTAWYGNDGVRSLPAAGIYGIGSAGDETVLHADYKPTHWNTPGLFGVKDTLTQNWKLLAGGAVALLAARHYKWI